jgi:hypothetical protein
MLRQVLLLQFNIYIAIVQLVPAANDAATSFAPSVKSLLATAPLGLS